MFPIKAHGDELTLNRIIEFHFVPKCTWIIKRDAISILWWFAANLTLLLFLQFRILSVLLDILHKAFDDVHFFVVQPTLFL